jgi:hypothetical protein
LTPFDEAVARAVHNPAKPPESAADQSTEGYSPVAGER